MSEENQTQKKLLSICIPTYNRPNKLKRLYDFFLRRALNEYSNQIEIVVCDNSDNKNAQLNQTTLGNSVHYSKNEINLGFSGNLVRCAEEATGQFIWFISDDDLVDWNGFRRLIDYLPYAAEQGIDCIMLPYFTKNNSGEVKIYNDSNSWGKGRDVDIATFVTPLRQLPFVLFSSVVVRLDKKNLNQIAKEFSGNFLIQIPFFFSMLKMESKLHFLDDCVIEFISDSSDGDWRLALMYRYKIDVFLFLKRYGIDVATLMDNGYKEMLLCMLSHRGGIANIEYADKDRWSVLADLGHHLNMKTILLAFALIVPKVLIRQPYIFYQSIKYAQDNRNLSIKTVVSRYKTLQHHTPTNNS
ncbi:Glycosyl transferase family 2 [uncultured archaeon]|nr:Glycosyl transferase family 2 [uncultured archaeon]